MTTAPIETAPEVRAATRAVYAVFTLLALAGGSIALFLCGLANGSRDVAMNVQGAIVERRLAGVSVVGLVGFIFAGSTPLAFGGAVLRALISVAVLLGVVTLLASAVTPLAPPAGHSTGDSDRATML